MEVGVELGFWKAVAELLAEAHPPAAKPSASQCGDGGDAGHRGEEDILAAVHNIKIVIRATERKEVCL